VLSRKHRLRRPADFGRVRNRGRCWSNRQIVLCRCKNDLDRTRIGFSASKRIGNAVVRNRTRRLLRHAARAHLPLIEPGWDIVIIARKGIIGADYGDIEKAMAHLLAQSRLLSHAPDDAPAKDLAQAPCGCERTS
jgi:ribonuclease P protein component